MPQKQIKANALDKLNRIAARKHLEALSQSKPKPAPVHIYKDPKPLKTDS
jgi:hypothetical protein